jgi:hypothetical protein
MNLKPWESTIQNIVDEFSHSPKDSDQQKILIVWRAKLEKKPTSLPPFQIDEIVREVRKRVPIVKR